MITLTSINKLYITLKSQEVQHFADVTHYENFTTLNLGLVSSKDNCDLIFKLTVLNLVIFRSKI